MSGPFTETKSSGFGSCVWRFENTPGSAKNIPLQYFSASSLVPFLLLNAKHFPSTSWMTSVGDFVCGQSCFGFVFGFGFGFGVVVIVIFVVVVGGGVGGVVGIGMLPDPVKKIYGFLTALRLVTFGVFTKVVLECGPKSVGHCISLL